jgi:hypothetical protein
MKTLHLSIICILVLCSNGAVYAQYGLYGKEALDHQSLLQKELNLARTQIEKHQQDEQQTKNITDAITLASVGIPLAAGISVGVLLFARKRK